MRTERFRTEGPPRLTIRNAVGSIDLETVDGDETVVELEPLSGDAGGAVEAAIVEQRGDGIVVEIPERRRLAIVVRDARVRVVIRCPHGTRLEVSTVSADTRARGRYGEVDYKGVSADVHIDDVGGDARVKTVSGDVEVGGVGGRVAIQSVSGDVEVERAGAAAELRAVSGDVRIGTAAASVTTQTVSGDQQIGAVVDGTVQAKSVSGDVTVGVTRGASVWVDAKSVSGSTRSELELSDDPVPAEDDGRRIEIRANALSGDIRVIRAG